MRHVPLMHIAFLDMARKATDGMSYEGRGEGVDASASVADFRETARAMYVMVDRLLPVQ